MFDMLKKLTFLTDHRCFKKGDVITFDKLTLLVGDQGSGKSTILELLGDSKKFKEKDIFKAETENNVRLQTYWFDYEKHNPRKNSVFEGWQAKALFSSHGEFVRTFNETICRKEGSGACFLMDEPDAALSIRSCLKLASGIKFALERGSQIIASVHSPTVMEQFDKVFSLEHRKWMSSQEFIRSQHHGA